MANQTLTTTANYDEAALTGLANGETITINAGAMTINSDVRWAQNAAAFGSVTISSTLGGSVLIDGGDVWEIAFDASSGNVPTVNAYGSNGVTGGTSGATGELLRVWASGSLTPSAAGGAMPATGWIKLRTKSGTFQDNETITLPGGTLGRGVYHAVTCAATFTSGAVRERSLGVRLVDRIVIGRRAKDPGDTVRFVVEWADWLKQYGTTIASGSWIVADQLGVTTETSVTASSPTSITLSGGTVRGGKVFTIDNRIVAANGLRDMQSFELSIQNL